MSIVIIIVTLYIVYNFKDISFSLFRLLKQFYLYIKKYIAKYIKDIKEEKEMDTLEEIKQKEREKEWHQFLKKENIKAEDFDNFRKSLIPSINQWLDNMIEENSTFIFRGWDFENQYSIDDIVLKTNKGKTFNATIHWDKIPMQRVVSYVTFKDEECATVFGELCSNKIKHINYNSWYSYFNVLTNDEKLLNYLNEIKSKAMDSNNEIIIKYSDIVEKDIDSISNLEIKAFANILIDKFAFSNVDVNESDTEILFKVKADETMFVKVKDIPEDAIIY